MSTPSPEANEHIPIRFQELCFEWLRPGQLKARREEADIAFLPLGALEWHGVQNPLGLDAIKAHHICCLAAEILGGGVVFPPLVWGLPRDSFFVDTQNFHDAELPAKIAAAYGTTTERVLGTVPHGGMDRQEQWLFYQRLLRMSLEQIAGFGFSSIYICAGHAPLIHFLRPVAIAFVRAMQMAGSPISIDWGGEGEAADLRADHGGRWETSLMMAINSPSVDLNCLDVNPEYKGVGSNPNAAESTGEQGEDWLCACAEGIAREARWMVEYHPALTPRCHHLR